MSKKNKQKNRGGTYVAPKAHNAPSQSELLQLFSRELMRIKTYNPNVTSSKKTYSYGGYTKENVLKWLQSPSASEKSLRDASNYMYIASMHYNRLIRYYSKLYVGSYVVLPVGFDSKSIPSNFDKQYRKVCTILSSMKIPSKMSTIIDYALRDGVFYGIRVSDTNSCNIFRIDPDYCKIVAICDDTFLYAVDMTKLTGKLEFYPTEFTAMYQEYLRTGNKWQEVPLDCSVCIKSDESLVDYVIPQFAAVLPDLYTIANTKELQETAAEIRNYKMLAGQIPYDDKGNVLIPDPIVDKYYDHIANALGVRVGLALSPFKLEALTFDNKAGITDIDDVAKAEDAFWSTAGSSGLLHGKTNDTAGVTKLAIKNDESYVWGIVQQFEAVINRYLKSGFGGKAKFRISILPITIFNQEEKIQQYKEAATLGIGKMYYAAALGIDPSDIAGMNCIETDILPFAELKPLKSTYTESASGDGGRPASPDTDLTPSGENTRDNDTNANK